MEPSADRTWRRRRRASTIGGKALADGELVGKGDTVLGHTYGGVDWLIACHGGVLAGAVVGLAEGHAGQTVGDQAYRGSVWLLKACVRPKHVQRSMGSKQPKKLLCHSRESSGLFWLMCSPLLERTSLKRFIQSFMSLWSMGPAPWAGAAAGAAGTGCCCCCCSTGADIVASDSQRKGNQGEIKIEELGVNGD